MTFLWLKWLHILSATLMFGTGLGTAFYKWWADRHGDPATRRTVMHGVVTADWWITTPTVIVQPVTGIWMARLAGYPLDEGWVLWALILYGVAGACWLPVVWLQLRMRDLCDQAASEGREVDVRYRTYSRLWLALGVPAFSALVVVYYLMVFKSVP